MKTFVCAILFTLLSACPAFAAEELKKVRVGYVPGIFTTSLAVIKNRGWDHENGFDLELSSYSMASAIIQSLYRGDVDFMFVAPSVFLTAKQKGGDFKVVGATMVDAAHLIGSRDFSTYAKGQDPVGALKNYLGHTGRKPVIATHGKGTSPDTMLRYWLDNNELVDDVEIITGGVEQLQQHLIAQTVDLILAWEPQITIAQEKGAGVEIFLKGADMLTGQPLAGLGIRQDFYDEQPEIAQRLIDLHVKATHEIKQAPDLAAFDYDAIVSKGLVDIKTLQKGMQSAKEYFTADPHHLIKPTQTSIELMIKLGVFDEGTQISGLFDTSLYDNAMQVQ